MKSIILKYWWVLIGIFAALELISTCLLLTSLIFWTNLASLVCVMIFLTLFVSWVYLIKYRKWRQFLVSFISTIIISTVSLVISLHICLYLPVSDDFGRRHPIPEGMTYSIPLAEERHETERADSLDNGPYLQIRNDFQGGMYLYDFHYGALPAGEIFLKCYEVTENIPLSADRIPEKSKVSIEGSSSFAKLVDKQGFTIYEGDWGDYYAARIEVWHRDAETQYEQKLYEKVFRVEGWMR